MEHTFEVTHSVLQPSSGIFINLSFSQKFFTTGRNCPPSYLLLKKAVLGRNSSIFPGIPEHARVYKELLPSYLTVG